MGFFNFFIKLIDNLTVQKYQENSEQEGTLGGFVLSEKFIIETQNDIYGIKTNKHQHIQNKHQNKYINNRDEYLNKSYREFQDNYLTERKIAITNKTANAVKFQNFISEGIMNNNIKFDAGIFEGIIFMNGQPTINEIIGIIMTKLHLENLIALYERIDVLKEVFDQAKKYENLRTIRDLKLVLEENQFKFNFSWNSEDENCEPVCCEYTEEYNAKPNKSYYNSMNVAYKIMLNSNNKNISQNVFHYIVQQSVIIDNSSNSSTNSLENNEVLTNTELDSPEFDKFLTDYKNKFKFNAGVFKGVKFKNIIPTNEEIKRTLLFNISPKNIELLCNRVKEIKYLLDNIKSRDWSRCPKIELGKKSFIIEFCDCRQYN